MWRPITAEEFDEHMDIMGEHAVICSGFTDMDGEFGDPVIERTYARDDAPDEPILRHVQRRDVLCEHYFYEGGA